MAHTPGEWMLKIQPPTETQNTWAFIYTEDNLLIASSSLPYNGNIPVSEKVENWRLMSTAPDLLAACEVMAEQLAHCLGETNKAVIQGRAAIAKAKGDD